jgi:hypothetical protein
MKPLPQKDAESLNDDAQIDACDVAEARTVGRQETWWRFDRVVMPRTYSALPGQGAIPAIPVRAAAKPVYPDALVETAEVKDVSRWTRNRASPRATSSDAA